MVRNALKSIMFGPIAQMFILFEQKHKEPITKNPG